MYMIKNRFSGILRLIALVMVCLFTINTLAWAYPPEPSAAKDNTLAIQSIFKPLADEGVTLSAKMEFEILAGALLLISGKSPGTANAYIAEAYTRSSSAYTRKIKFLDVARSEGGLIATFEVLGMNGLVFEVNFQGALPGERGWNRVPKKPKLNNDQSKNVLRYVDFFQQNGILTIRKLPQSGDAPNEGVSADNTMTPIAYGMDGEVYKLGDRVYKVYRSLQTNTIMRYKRLVDLVKTILDTTSDTVAIEGSKYSVSYNVVPILEVSERGDGSVVAISDFVSGSTQEGSQDPTYSVLKKLLEAKTDWLSEIVGPPSRKILLPIIDLAQDVNVKVRINREAKHIEIVITDICSRIYELEYELEADKDVAAFLIRRLQVYKNRILQKSQNNDVSARVAAVKIIGGTPQAGERIRKILTEIFQSIPPKHADLLKKVYLKKNNIFNKNADGANVRFIRPGCIDLFYDGHDDKRLARIIAHEMGHVIEARMPDAWKIWRGHLNVNFLFGSLFPWIAMMISAGTMVYIMLMDLVFKYTYPSSLLLLCAVGMTVPAIANIQELYWMGNQVFVSDYAASSLAEDFAESYMMYVLYREEFFSNAQKHPLLLKRYEAMQEIFGNDKRSTINDQRNVTCGTICQKGHEGSYKALDEQLKRKFIEYKTLLGITEDRDLTEAEVDIALARQGHIKDPNQLDEIRKWVRIQGGIPDNISIFFGIPEDSKRLWYVGEDYAGGHFNQKGTRIHISLPLILSQSDPKQAALAIARHDYNHILGNGHQEDPGMMLVRKIAEEYEISENNLLPLMESIPSTMTEELRDVISKMLASSSATIKISGIRILLNMPQDIRQPLLVRYGEFLKKYLSSILYSDTDTEAALSRVVDRMVAATYEDEGSRERGVFDLASDIMKITSDSHELLTWYPFDNSIRAFADLGISTPGVQFVLNEKGTHRANANLHVAGTLYKLGLVDDILTGDLAKEIEDAFRAAMGIRIPEEAMDEDGIVMVNRIPQSILKAGPAIRSADSDIYVLGELALLEKAHAGQTFISHNQRIDKILKEIVRSGKTSLLSNAVEALGKTAETGDKEAIGLIRDLFDKYSQTMMPSMRLTCYEALARLGALEPGEVDNVRDHLKDTNEFHRLAALRIMIGIEGITEEEAANLLDNELSGRSFARHDMSRLLLQKGWGFECVMSWIEKLKAGDEYRRGDAIELIGIAAEVLHERIGRNDAGAEKLLEGLSGVYLPFLIESLSSPDDGNRYKAAMAIVPILKETRGGEATQHSVNNSFGFIKFLYWFSIPITFIHELFHAVMVFIIGGDLLEFQLLPIETYDKTTKLSFMRDRRSIMSYPVLMEETKSSLLLHPHIGWTKSYELNRRGRSIRASIDKLFVSFAGPIGTVSAFILLNAVWISVLLFTGSLSWFLYTGPSPFIGMWRVSLFLYSCYGITASMVYLVQKLYHYLDPTEDYEKDLDKVLEALGEIILGDGALVRTRNGMFDYAFKLFREEDAGTALVRKSALREKVKDAATRLEGRADLKDALSKAADVLYEVSEGRSQWPGYDQWQRVKWHGYTHAADMALKAIASMQNVRKADPAIPIDSVLIAAIAAMYHDIGYYKVGETGFGTIGLDHELRSMDFVSENHMALGLTESDVKLINIIIYATRLSFDPAELARVEAESAGDNDVMGAVYGARVLGTLDVYDTRDEMLEDPVRLVGMLREEYQDDRDKLRTFVRSAVFQRNVESDRMKKANDQLLRLEAVTMPSDEEQFAATKGFYENVADRRVTSFGVWDSFIPREIRDAFEIFRGRHFGKVGSKPKTKLTKKEKAAVQIARMDVERQGMLVRCGIYDAEDLSFVQGLYGRFVYGGPLGRFTSHEKVAIWQYMVLMNMHLRDLPPHRRPPGQKTSFEIIEDEVRDLSKDLEVDGLFIGYEWADHLPHKDKVLSIENNVTIRPGARMLDIECGYGNVIIDLAIRNPKSEFVGIDANPYNLSHAVTRLIAMGDKAPKNLRIHIGDARKQIPDKVVPHRGIPYPDDAFDVVSLLEGIMDEASFKDPWKGLLWREAVRVTKKDGGSVVFYGLSGMEAFRSSLPDGVGAARNPNTFFYFRSGVKAKYYFPSWTTQDEPSPYRREKCELCVWELYRKGRDPDPTVAKKFDPPPAFPRAPSKPEQKIGDQTDIAEWLALQDGTGEEAPKPEVVAKPGYPGDGPGGASVLDAPIAKLEEARRIFEEHLSWSLRAKATGDNIMKVITLLEEAAGIFERIIIEGKGADEDMLGFQQAQAAQARLLQAEELLKVAQDFYDKWWRKKLQSRATPSHTYPGRTIYSQSVVEQLAGKSGTVLEIGVGSGNAPTFRELKDALGSKVAVKAIEFSDGNIPPDLQGDITRDNILALRRGGQAARLIGEVKVIRIANLAGTYFSEGQRERLLHVLDRLMPEGAYLIISDNVVDEHIDENEEGLLYQKVNGVLELQYYLSSYVEKDIFESVTQIGRMKAISASSEFVKVPAGLWPPWQEKEHVPFVSREGAGIEESVVRRQKSTDGRHVVTEVTNDGARVVLRDTKPPVADMRKSVPPRPALESKGSVRKHPAVPRERADEHRLSPMGGGQDHGTIRKLAMEKPVPELVEVAHGMIHDGLEGQIDIIREALRQKNPTMLEEFERLLYVHERVKDFEAPRNIRMIREDAHDIVGPEDDIALGAILAPCIAFCAFNRRTGERFLLHILPATYQRYLKNGGYRADDLAYARAKVAYLDDKFKAIIDSPASPASDWVFVVAKGPDDMFAGGLISPEDVIRYAHGRKGMTPYQEAAMPRVGIQGATVVIDRWGRTNISDTFAGIGSYGSVTVDLRNEPQEKGREPSVITRGSSDVKIMPLTREFLSDDNAVKEILRLHSLIPAAHPLTREQLMADRWEEGGYSRPFPGKWGHSLVAVDKGGKPVGLLIAYERIGGEMDGVYMLSLYIHGFAVDPGLQGSGIGTEMLYTLAKNLEEEGFLSSWNYRGPPYHISLQALPTNYKAIRFYENMGFKKVGTKAYPERVDNVYLTRANDIIASAGKIKTALALDMSRKAGRGNDLTHGFDGVDKILRFEHKDERALMVEAARSLAGYPVNMPIGISLIPRQKDGLTPEQEAGQLDENMETLARIMAWHNMFGLDVHYALMDSDEDYKAKALELLRAKLGQLAGIPGMKLNVDEMLELSAESNAIEVPLVDIERLKAGMDLQDRSLPVALVRDIEGIGFTMPNYTAAAAIGLSLAGLRAALEKEGAAGSKKKFEEAFGTIERIYKRWGVKREGFKEDTLHVMVNFEKFSLKTRLDLIIDLDLALPPILKAAIEKLHECHKALQLMLQSA